MFKHLSVINVGLALAIVTSGFHLGWSLLVAAGWAQPVIDFVFWAHFIKPIYAVEPFELSRAVVLVGMTAGVGFAIGSAFALGWNVVHRAS